MSTDSPTVAPAPDVLCQELDGEAVLMDSASQKYYGLDEVGNFMWQQLVEHGRTEPVVRALLDEFEVEEDVARTDLEAFVERLLEMGLLRRNGAKAPGAEVDRLASD